MRCRDHIRAKTVWVHALVKNAACFYHAANSGTAREKKAESTFGVWEELLRHDDMRSTAGTHLPNIRNGAKPHP